MISLSQTNKTIILQPPQNQKSFPKIIYGTIINFVGHCHGWEFQANPGRLCLREDSERKLCPFLLGYQV